MFVDYSSHIDADRISVAKDPRKPRFCTFNPQFLGGQAQSPAVADCGEAAADAGGSSAGVGDFPEDSQFRWKNMGKSSEFRSTSGISWDISCKNHLYWDLG